MAARRATALALALFVFGFGEELWFRYLPEYLRALGASAFTLGLFGTLKDFLDAAYAYPGGRISDRLGTRRALLLFGALSTAGFAILWMVIVSCLVKVAVQIDLARWTIATGSPALSGYNRVPPRLGPIGWINVMYKDAVLSLVIYTF